MTQEEKQKYDYLDTIISAIKMNGNSSSLGDLLNKLEGDNDSKIVQRLISESNFLNRALAYLIKKEIIEIYSHSDDKKGEIFTLTFQGELIHSQGG